MKLEDIIIFSLSFEGNIWMNRGSKGLKFIYASKEVSSYNMETVLIHRINLFKKQNKGPRRAKHSF